MKSDRISIPSEIGRHGDGRRGMGNAAPGLRSDEGLVGEPDDDGICLQTLSLMNAHLNRSTLPFSPAVVVHDGDSGWASMTEGISAAPVTTTIVAKPASRTCCRDISRMHRPPDCGRVARSLCSDPKNLEPAPAAKRMATVSLGGDCDPCSEEISTLSSCLMTSSFVTNLQISHPEYVRGATNMTVVLRYRVKNPSGTGFEMRYERFTHE